MAIQDNSKNFTKVPWLYRLFFLYIEPLSTIIGAYYAYCQPSEYLSLTAHSPLTVTADLGSREASTAVEVALAQLANLYLLFAINEALVLRCVLNENAGVDGRGRRVWSTLLTGLLVADFGHLWSVQPYKGRGVYWDVLSWNAIDGGNVGFVYLGAMMRVCWLLGIGLNCSQKGAKARQ